MSTLPEEMKQSELVHQFVLDRQTLETVGRIEQLWMYPKQHRVLGLICQSTLLKGRKSVFKLSQLQSFGNNGILVQGQAQDTDAATVRQLESLLNYELWSPAGDRLGKIVDYRFYVNNGLIRHYLWVPRRLNQLTGDVYELPADEILKIGNQRVLVSEAIAQTPTLAQEGLQQKLKQVKQELKEDYSNLTQGLQSWVQQAQTLALQTKEQAKTWVNQATLFDLDLDLDAEKEESAIADSAKPSDFDDRRFEDWDETPQPEPKPPVEESSRTTSTVATNPPVSSNFPPDSPQSSPSVAEDAEDKESWLNDEADLLAAIPEEDLQGDDPWI